MKTKHTPGPWHVGRKQNHGGTTSAERIVSEDGEAICAELNWHDDGEANARLIAAAPDHALICWAMCVGSGRWEPWGDGRGEFCINGLRYATKLDDLGCPVVTDGMRAAIAKATGDEP